MTGSTQTLPYMSPGPLRLPPGAQLETVEELPGDSDLDDDSSVDPDYLSDVILSNLDDDDDEDDGGSLRERDPVFEKIKETLTKSQTRSDSVVSGLSTISDESDGPHVQISAQYTSIPYGIQPRATYEHSNLHGDIMGVAYNGRMRQFVILDSKGITTWKRDIVDPRDWKFLETKDLTPKVFKLNQAIVRRALQYPKYEYRLIMNIVYAPKYNCYFALGKDFSVKVLNRDFEETCSVNTNMRSVLFILFNPVRDELITGGVGGIKIWQFQQVAGRAFTELKPLANYELRLKESLVNVRAAQVLYLLLTLLLLLASIYGFATSVDPDQGPHCSLLIADDRESLANVGGSWVKRLDLDHHLQHLYCCSDTDLHVYDLSGKLLFKFERAHTMSITGCCFSPAAKVLITASVDSEVKVWSLTGGLVHTFRGHSRAVTSLLLHPETSSIIITSSLDGSVRMWSLDTMDLLYMIVVSADGVMWMGLTDDKLLYISTCRNITLWHLNNFYAFWSLARNHVTRLSLASCENKTTRVLAEGEDSSVRMFTRCNQKNITTVLPPPDISPLQKVISVCYSREKNAAFLLITNREIWVYTTRTDPSCRIATWDVHDLQIPYISGDTSNLPPGVIIQPPSQTMSTHRATENGHGNEIISNCCSLCILNSTAMMWTDEGLCCPIRHTYLLLGMEDGRILFMDPVIKGQKYMELKASKDAIEEMSHDVNHSCLITLCRLKTLVLVQIWGLPQLDAMHEIYCGPDVTAYARMGSSFLTGHTSGQINLHVLEPMEDLGIQKAKQEPQYESIVDENKRSEHQAPVVAMDSLGSLRLFVTCSSDGAIKIWDEGKVLVTEVMLEESLSAACFLNEMGDLLVAFKNHIFYIDHSKLCPAFKPPEIEAETSDQESDVYEDPRVLYELIKQDDEPVTLQNYLVPYDHIEFDKDFLEGKTKIEQPKAGVELSDESGSESETDISLAPSSIYMSPSESIESLSMIDLTLGAEYSKYDLRKQMKTTLDHMVMKVKEEDKWKNLKPARRWLKLHRIQVENAKHSKYVHKRKRRGRRRKKQVTIESGQSDLEEKELEMEMEKFTLPAFGVSPGGSPVPSVTPPSGQATPKRDRDGTQPAPSVVSDDEGTEQKPSGFVPIEPDAVKSSVTQHGRSPIGQSPKQISIRPTKSDKHPKFLYTPRTILSKPKPTVSRHIDSWVKTPQTLTKVRSVSVIKSRMKSSSPPSKAGRVQVSTTSDILDHKSQSISKMTSKSERRRSSDAQPVTQVKTQQSPSRQIGAGKPLPFVSFMEHSTASRKHTTKPSALSLQKESSPLAEASITKQNMNIKSGSQPATKHSVTASKLPSTVIKSDTQIHGGSVEEADKEKHEAKIAATAAVSTQSSEFALVLHLMAEMSDEEDEVISKAETPPIKTEPHDETVDEESPSDTVTICDTDSGVAGSELTQSQAADAMSVVSNVICDAVSPRLEEVAEGALVFKHSKSPVVESDSEERDLFPVGLVEGLGPRSRASTPAGQIEKPVAVYSDDEQVPKRVRSKKVDVRGLMKKRRITSARAPSLTRRSSTDHMHDDHDHDHGHDDRNKKELKKKQQQLQQDRNLPPRLDKNKLLNLPPNPPSMLTRKHSLSEQRKNLEIHLLHRPELRRDHDPAPPPADAQVHYHRDSVDLDQLQEDQWAAEAGLHGTTLTLPPQRDKHQARQLDGAPSRLSRDRRRFGDEPAEGHIPGVGSSPTAELEQGAGDREPEKSIRAYKEIEQASIYQRDESERVDESGEADNDGGKDIDTYVDLDTNMPETQMQRARRLGLKVDAGKVFDDFKADKGEAIPRALVRRSKLNVYIPQAEKEPLSARSSRRGTPDSGIDDALLSPAAQTPRVSVKLAEQPGQEKKTEEEQPPVTKEDGLLTEEDKANAIRRPASSFTGLRRGQLEGEKLRAERPHTAHVRFKAELELIVEWSDPKLGDLQTAFEEALEKYQDLPGNPHLVSAEKLYKNDGVTFEENWQERVIKRHTLLRMQKEIRAQSAAQRRQAIDMIRNDKHTPKLFTSRCDSAVGDVSVIESIQTVRQANTSMSVPITMGYGVSSAPPPSRDKARPKTAAPVMEKQQMIKSELSQEKAFRFKLGRNGSSRPSSCKSVSSVAEFSPHWIDPRNPDAWRPKSSRSIPSKCNRYVLVNKPKEKQRAPVPSPLEEQLIIERFPKMGSKIIHSMPDSVIPKSKKSSSMEYSPFVYQRFV